MAWTAESIAGDGRLDEALDWFSHAAQPGESGAFGLMAIALHDAGRVEDAETWCTVALLVGDFTVATTAANWLAESGHLDQALGLYDYAASAGDAHALWWASSELRQASRGRGSTSLERAAAAGVQDMMRWTGRGRTPAQQQGRDHLFMYGWTCTGSPQKPETHRHHNPRAQDVLND